MIVVEGHTLTGMAVAARLARLGHEVGIAGDERPRPPLDHFELPAAWRDLAKKSGRPLAGALGALGLTLAPAPPTTYLLPDGLELVLPDERGGQYYAIRGALGESQAAQWRDLLDELDSLWAAWRRFGLEQAAAPRTAADRRALWLDRTVADVADRAGRLAPIMLAEGWFAGTDSPAAPALVTLRQVLVRTFGRHRLVDSSGATADARALVTMLEHRLDERGVRRLGPRPARPAADERRFDARPHLPRGLVFRARPALVAAARDGEPGEPRDVVDLTGNAPVRTIRGERRATVVDHGAARPDLAAGIAPDDSRRLLRRSVPDARHASATSLAGGEAWAELLSGALAVYALHEELTGEDCRPSNRAFVMPRLSGAAD